MQEHNHDKSARGYQLFLCVNPKPKLRKLVVRQSEQRITEIKLRHEMRTARYLADDEPMPMLDMYEYVEAMCHQIGHNTFRMHDIDADGSIVYLPHEIQNDDDDELEF